MSTQTLANAPWQTAARRIKHRLHELGMATVLLDADGRIYTLAGAQVRTVGTYDDQVPIEDIAADLKFCLTERPPRRIFDHRQEETTHDPETVRQPGGA